MYIEVRGEGSRARVVLSEPDDCKKFKVVVDGSVAVEALSAALAGIGRTAGREAVWVQPEAIRRLAAGRVDGTWDAAFSRMVEFARTKGWVDETTGEIRAHCEWR
jgi:hypothetical protein